MQENKGRAFYESTVKRLPFQVILNSGAIFYEIATLANTDSLSLAHTLVAALMRPKNYLELLERWARQQCHLVDDTMDSDDLAKYMEFKTLGLQFFELLKYNKLYFHNRLCYKVEEVMEDGSLLLTRIDSFEVFEKLSQL